jgi:hypothetical protein
MQKGEYPGTTVAARKTPEEFSDLADEFLPEWREI